MNIQSWYDFRDKSSKKSTVEFLVNNGAEAILMNAEDLDGQKLPSSVFKIPFITNATQLEKIADGFICSESELIITQAQAKNLKTVYYAKVTNEKTMLSAQQKAGKVEYLIVELQDSTNIPLELLIASCQSTKTSVIKVVKNYQDAETTLSVMDVGSDGIMMKGNDLNEMGKTMQFLYNRSLGQMKLVEAVVTEVQHIGRGCRACIDTTDILEKDEGFIVGSTSNGGLLVSSETHYLPYMNLRPFRVNAGAIHSYIWSPDNMTQYLSDLSAGKKVLCVKTDGTTRCVSVGRVKMEKRPLLMICAQHDGYEINTIVQDDWHIRLLGSNQNVLNASEIQVGEKILAWIHPAGRHVGIEIKEDLREQ